MPQVYEPRFITELATLDHSDNDGPKFLLTAPLRYVTDVEHFGTFEAPAGFVTDFASIPQAIQNILPLVGAYDYGAVLHDWLYRQGRFWPGGSAITRATADAVLNEAMRVKAVTPWKRYAIYAGVRAGGWVTWQRYRRGERQRG